MAYGFVCVRCGRLELAHDGVITEADGEIPSHTKLRGFKVALQNCKKYIISSEEKLVIKRDKKVPKHSLETSTNLTPG